MRSLEQAVALVQESSPNALFSAKAVLCEKAIGTDLEHTRNILFFHVPSLGTDWNRLGTHLEQTTFIVNTNHLGLLPDRLYIIIEDTDTPAPSLPGGMGRGGEGSRILIGGAGELFIGSAGKGVRGSRS